MAMYTVRGTVDNPAEQYYVELLDDDQQWYEDKADDLLGSTWTHDGSFEISFDDSLYKEITEFKPELFIKVRDKNGKVVYTSPKKSPTGHNDSENLSFYNLSTVNLKFDPDPYSSSNARRTSAFSRISDSITVGVGDIQNTSTLLIHTLNAWFSYSNELGWKNVGYDGPQVPRYPWKESHKHELSWNK